MDGNNANNSTSPPKITVLMPVYNGQSYVAEAIESILNQTFEDFEFLIIDDGSTDQSSSIIEKYATRDSRIRLLTRKHRGLIATLNEGIDLAHGTYIARMDCDDFSFPQRLVKQYQFMLAHPDYVLCGSAAEFRTFSKTQKTVAQPDFVKSKIPWSSVLFSAPFIHASAFFNKEAFQTGNFYYDYNYPAAEDMELWGRIVLGGHHCGYIREALVRRQLHAASVSVQQHQLQLISTLKIIERNLQQLGQQPLEGTLHHLLNTRKNISSRDYEQANLYLMQVLNWLNKLPDTEKSHLYPRFKYFIKYVLFYPLCHYRDITSAAKVMDNSQLRRIVGSSVRIAMQLSRLFPDTVVLWVLRKIKGQRRLTTTFMPSINDGPRLAQDNPSAR